MKKLTKALLAILIFVLLLFAIVVWPGKLYQWIENKYGQKNQKTSTQLLDEGAAKIGNDNYNEAQSLLEEAVKKDPRNFTAWINLGITYMNLKNTEKAEKAFRAAVNLDNKSSSSYNLLGNAQRDLTNTDEAIKSYQKPIELNLKQYNAYINLASLYFNENKYNEAIAVLIQGKNNIPEYKEIRYMLVSFYIKLGQKIEAKTEINQILAKNPNDKWAKERLNEL